ncbi:MAG: maleylpyruvate isomerase family mycothiol-dependent enzyme [Acidimicrobiia bacterium]
MTDPTDIPPIDRDEMVVLATEEYRRLLALFEDLSPAEWQTQTVCDDWDVRLMVAHLVGAAEGNASMVENVRQLARGTRLAKRMGRDQIDGINAVQVADREHLSTEQLVERLREVAPRAVTGRYRTPGLMRRISVPDPVAGRLSLGHLMDVIYTRDQWLHRVDISRATGREVELTANHDGRIVADVVAEWARLHGRPFELVLTGLAGGKYGTGSGESFELDAVDFCWAASGRGGEVPLGQKVLF